MNKWNSKLKNDIIDENHIPSNIKSKYSYEKSFVYLIGHPKIINCNENLSIVPGKYESRYKEYTIIYQFHLFMKNKGISITDFPKQFRDFFKIKFIDNKIVTNYGFRNSIEYKEFEKFVYTNGFYINKIMFECKSFLFYIIALMLYTF